MLLWACLIVLAIFLQSTFLGMLPFTDVKPDLVLLIVMHAAFTKGAKRGASVGFFGGLAEDFVSGGLLGVNAIVKVLAGYALGAFGKKFDYGSRSFQFMAVLALSAATHLAVFFILNISGQKVSTARMGNTIFPFALLNAVLAPFVLQLLKKTVKYDKSKPD